MDGERASPNAVGKVFGKLTEFMQSKPDLPWPVVDRQHTDTNQDRPGRVCEG